MSANTILTNDQIIEMAPAAGAIAPIDGVSAKYTFVPTVTAVDLLREAGWEPIDASQSGVRKLERDGFQKHLIRFARPELVGQHESIHLLLYNSHDRGCAFKLMAGIWRFVCSNGLVVGDEIANFSHKHMGFSPDDFMESSVKIADAAGDISGRVEDMKMIELRPEEQDVFAQSAHTLVYGVDPEKEPPITPNQLLGRKRFEDRGNDLWTTFNAVQENIVRGGVEGSIIGANGRRRKSTTRPIKALDKNLKLNQALWTLTQKMAELKV